MDESEDLKQDVEYAGFSPRLYASVIDTVLSSFLLYPLAGILKNFYGESLPSIALMKRLAYLPQNSKTTEEARQNFHAVIEEGLFADYMLETLGYFLLLGAIIVVFWMVKDATPGKKIMGMRIVDSKTLEPPTLFQYIVRMFAYILSILPLMLGFFWAMVDKKHRCVHDLVAGTAVIKIKRISTNIDSLSDESD